MKFLKTRYFCKTESILTKKWKTGRNYLADLCLVICGVVLFGALDVAFDLKITFYMNNFESNFLNREIWRKQTWLDKLNKCWLIFIAITRKWKIEMKVNIGNKDWYFGSSVGSFSMTLICENIHHTGPRTAMLCGFESGLNDLNCIFGLNFW